MRGMDWLAVIIGVLLFALDGLLWYVRPSDAMWLLGSVAWGCITYPAFMWYVTRRR